MKILVSAFEPFAGQRQNSSEIVLQSVKQDLPDLEAAILPVEFSRCFSELKKEINRVNPKWVLLMGQAEKREVLGIERVALNWWDAPVADNRGFQPIDRPIIKGAPEALFSEAPVREMVDALEQIGLKAEISYNAGTFVCNDLYFQTLEDSNQSDYQTVFLHWPLLQHQDGSKEQSLPLELACRGLKTLIDMLSNAED